VSGTLVSAGEHDHLEPGMVLAITGHVWQEGLGAVFRRDTVQITDSGAEVLSNSPF
jgi:Xaa-Pro aminopeptidase